LAGLISVYRGFEGRRYRFEARVWGLLNSTGDGAHLEDGQEHCHDDAAYDDAQKHDQNGLN
jgi:hypothetical protein